MRRFLEELRRRWWLVLAGVLILLVLFATRVATFWTDILWFQSVGFESVFWTVLTTQVGLGLAAGLVMTLLIAGNLLLAKRLTPSYRIPSAQEEGIERYRQAIEPFSRPLILTVAVAIGVLSGVSVAPEWEGFLLFANGVEFGQVDPEFGRDLSFFVFTLPFLTLVNSWLFTALAVTGVLTAIAHYLFGGIRPQSPGRKLTPQVNVHLSILLALIVGVRAWGFWLDRYMLSYSERGVVTGLGYTDANAQLVAFELLTVIAAVCVVLFLLNIRFQGWLLPSAGVAILVIAFVVLSGIYPAVIQRLQVDPQELEREEEFIDRNLELTRYGFGLDEVEFEPYPALDELDEETVDANQRTFEAIRLWDPATLQNTYRQLQELRPYYDFQDVDVDRYEFDEDEGLQQVMISVREVNEQNLDAAQTWENERLTYTHGFGLVSSAVSTKRTDGQPVFLVNDIPPQGVDKLEVDNPRLYYGERSPEYSIVRTDRPELDFPQEGDSPAVYEYTGEGGVGVGSISRRLGFALRFAEPNILISNLINEDSDVLFNRRIRDRVELAAPFLEFDHDPYPVAMDGRIKWVVDAYTTSNMLPYSQRVQLGDLTLAEQRELVPTTQEDGTLTLVEQTVEAPGIEGEANYIRNSVKAVVDAYDGSVDFYVPEPDDPIIQTWAEIFPDAFSEYEDAGEGMISHFRYPEDIFRVQAALFERYHIQDPSQFYTQEDAWEIPMDAAFFQNQEDQDPEQREQREMRPYYLLTRLPGVDQEEFALIQPYTPAERNNLIAWMAGRSDPEVYGELKAYEMPPTRTVFGPEQIQARIDQETEISEQIALWNQSGSRVIYGDLLVLPIEEALMYVQPLFLRAEQSDLPNLERVVVILGDQIEMAETLTEGLAALFGEAAPELALPEGTVEEDDVADAQAPEVDEEEVDEDADGEAGEMDPQATATLEEASAAFEEAEEALSNGDLGTYQERNAEASRLLIEALQMMGGSPAADALPDGEEALDEDDDAALDD
ncbi:UPF0182 family protein [Egibacter rhizosphaerae]|uniref:UPF0182 protein ER308_04605 n=1 Tax=Egibacter rhizosphaerae TaxID=1670831 RepID=A0A411YCI1_9ACTN|nr:UPF0182 family protein [Egibacter rhizosphaerae]QBI18896.1 UPF0182 family protein [Egibacter rhizosphaerae]